MCLGAEMVWGRSVLLPYNRPEYHFGRQPKYYSLLLVLIRREEIFCHDAARIKMSKIFSRSNKKSQYSTFKIISENNLQKKKISKR